MSEPTATVTAFPMGRCGRCDRSVLTFVDLNEAGDERRFCMDCGCEIESALQWAGLDELLGEGYYFGAPPRAGGGGCGGGCGGCSQRTR